LALGFGRRRGPDTVEPTMGRTVRLSSTEDAAVAVSDPASWGTGEGKEQWGLR